METSELESALELEGTADASEELTAEVIIELEAALLVVDDTADF